MFRTLRRQMTIAPQRVRAAKALLARYRRSQRRGRQAPARPVGFGQRRPRLKDPDSTKWPEASSNKTKPNALSSVVTYVF